MKTFACQCGNTLHFENSRCVSCGRDVGWCPSCKGMRSFTPTETPAYTCDHCQASTVQCTNYRDFQVCNQMVAVTTTWEEAPAYCSCCALNRTIPDLSIPGNQEKWYQLETAKRRLLYNLDLLDLPYASVFDGFELPLTFEFKDDVVEEDGQVEKTFTGHADGVITIHIREADPVEREKNRVAFGEAHRTLIGHFRHEIGHYYWQLLVQNRREEAFKAVFGDHDNPSYSEALDTYYRNGPAPDWPQRCVSAYASMHPWEDFAETFRAYLEMISVLDTAENVSLLLDEEEKESFAGIELDTLLRHYEQLGIKANELNRAMGLPDLVPEVFTPAVADKMRFIHRLVKTGRRMKRAWGMGQGAEGMG